MELQLVSKETAVLAKELGFDETCYNVLMIGENNRKVSIIGTFNSDKGLPNMICTLPTQELLAKWLRDIFKIHIVIEEGIGPNLEWEHNIREINKDFNDNLYLAKGQFSINSEKSSKTYEEALEEGLLKSLNLIKLAKTNLI